MAKEKKKKEQDKEKGSSSKIILIIVAIILGFILVAGAVFIGFMVANKNFEKKETTEVTTNHSVEEFTFKLEEFLVNLKDENKSKYLKINIYLGGDLANEKLQSELKAYTPQIRDVITKILRNKVSTEFTVEGEVLLKEEIKTSINEILTKGQITNVYFTDLIVQ